MSRVLVIILYSLEGFLWTFLFCHKFWTCVILFLTLVLLDSCVDHLLRIIFYSLILCVFTCKVTVFNSVLYWVIANHFVFGGQILMHNNCLLSSYHNLFPVTWNTWGICFFIVKGIGASDVCSFKYSIASRYIKLLKNTSYNEISF